MPLRALTNTNRNFVPATVTHPQTNTKLTGGHRSVVYRNANGRTYEAIVIGPGSSSGLKLMIPALRMKGAAVYIKDNIAAATTLKQTDRYFDRWPAQSPTV